MSLSPRQRIYRDDLLFEYDELTRQAFGESSSPSIDLESSNVCTVLQEMVDDLRDKHPDVNRRVAKHIGFHRPGRK